MQKHVVLLVGPKGVGKSSLGRLLERTYGFAHVEPETIWLRHAETRAEHPDPASWERAGFAKVAAEVARRLGSADVVVTDTTAASDETRSFVAALTAAASVAVIRMTASEATCRARIAARGAEGRLPADPALIARAHAASIAARLELPEASIDCEAALPSPIFGLPRVRSALSDVGVPARALQRTLRTERTILRPWRAEDAEPLARINADPAVAEHLVAPLSRSESDALVARIEDGMETYGLGPWALEVPGVHPLAGLCGTWVVGFEAPFTPAVEIVWRLAPEAWGHGYVTEAAKVALAHAFEEIALPEVVSFTAPGNRRSRQVMERLGMRRDEAGDFEHPRVPVGHPLRPHVLYRLSRDDWRAART